MKNFYTIILIKKIYFVFTKYYLCDFMHSLLYFSLIIRPDIQYLVRSKNCFQASSIRTKTSHFSILALYQTYSLQEIVLRILSALCSTSLSLSLLLGRECNAFIKQYTIFPLQLVFFIFILIVYSLYLRY